MIQMTAHDLPIPPVSSNAKANPAAPLLWCGVVLGPVFYVTFLIQALTRSGYDMTRHPISLLSLGGAGWIQILNFVVVGLLAIGLHLGAKQTLTGRAGGIWIPRLFLSFGIGMVVAGVFPPEPMLGFPPGSPNTLPTTMSVKAALHGLGFLLVFTSLTAVAFIFGARVATSAGWRIYSICTGLLIPLLLCIGFVAQRATSIAFIVIGVVAFGWVDVISWSLLKGTALSKPRTSPCN
jgi:hypothetical protein